MKIMIVGTSGCGKTTLGRRLSKLIGVKFTDLDDLFWLPGWVERTNEEFLNRIRTKLVEENWIICGNYSKVRDEIWEQADLILWLDLPLSTCLWRAFKRTLYLLVNNEAACNGNYETWTRFLGKKSILLWVWNTHAKRKKIYTSYGKTLTRLRSANEVEEFIKCQIIQS